MRTALLDQIKARRLAQGKRTSDMLLLTGISRQQYEKIEKDGNPSLSTLDKIVEGLDSEMVLVPKDMLEKVKRLLESGHEQSPQPQKEGEDVLFWDKPRNDRSDG